jgi:hypothetical protein
MPKSSQLTEKRPLTRKRHSSKSGLRASAPQLLGFRAIRSKGWAGVSNSRLLLNGAPESRIDTRVGLARVSKIDVATF